MLTDVFYTIVIVLGLLFILWVAIPVLIFIAAALSILAVSYVVYKVVSDHRQYLKDNSPDD